MSNIVPYNDSRSLDVPGHFKSDRGATIEAIIGGWLDSKFTRSKSQKTFKDYRDTLLKFRAFLLSMNADLLYHSNTFHNEIADAAQVFSKQRSPNARRKGDIATTTQAQRLAVLSSFYHYAIRRGHLMGGNPIDTVERPVVEPYSESQALAPEDVARRLEAIDISTLDGIRDLALLAVLLSTGRRVSEVASLTRKDVQVVGEQIKLSFRKTKGNKSISDLLTEEVSLILLQWLNRNYQGQFMKMPATTPLWVDVHHKTLRDVPLGYHGIAGVCQKYLGTSKVHTTRGTFAILMVVAGAKITDIQQRLQHSNAATTGIYMNKLTEEVNQYSGKITELLGLKKGQKK
jgi:integrase/recombinase XerD